MGEAGKEMGVHAKSARTAGDRNTCFWRWPSRSSNTSALSATRSPSETRTGTGAPRSSGAASAKGGAALAGGTAAATAATSPMQGCCDRRRPRGLARTVLIGATTNPTSPPR